MACPTVNVDDFEVKCRVRHPMHIDDERKFTWIVFFCRI